MKKILLLIIDYIISLVITLLFFYTMSWYSFNTFPTKLVLIRIIICSLLLTVIISMIYIYIKKLKNKRLS